MTIGPILIYVHTITGRLPIALYIDIENKLLPFHQHNYPGILVDNVASAVDFYGYLRQSV